ncbi:unnamed protein product [Hydatigera taeniaeformis]|uniref:BZIP domain-containing protein n=1 Tax=Hydatigena taeniaeformis TaxID=6205 RepID=A0A0R3XBC3_HYDTA|nr:unnamed protein product [Hydatigera taeniaeformis]
MGVEKSMCFLQAFIDAFDAEPEAEDEEIVEDKSTDEAKTADEEKSGVDCVGDADVGELNLMPNSEDEAEAAAAEEKAATLSKGLSAARRRQLERALRRKAGRAGRHFYEEVNTKNRKRRRGGAESRLSDRLSTM